MPGEGFGLSQTVSQGEICILKLRSDISSVSDKMLLHTCSLMNFIDA